MIDIGCGKGGDLQKWAKAGVDEYIGIGQSPGGAQCWVLSAMAAQAG